MAVKRILPNLAEDDEFITMFVDEAKTSVQLSHPNVCQIYELGELHGSYYIVMEYIAGRDLLALQNRFRRQKRIMAVTQAAYIIAAMCDGLDYAHRKVDDDGNEMGIIHRDISPQNVLISFDGDVKVIDFGIAKAATKSQQTQVGVLKGKFGYMSPEQVTGKVLDQRSDVFALGVLFWEMLTARRLFHAETDFATLEKVRNANVVAPSTKNSKVPEEIDRIVLKALTRDRNKRYQYASELADDLRDFLDTVQPAYTQKTLSGWMISAFREKVDAERNKIRDFQRFVTVEDVRSYTEAMLAEDSEIELLELDPDDDGTDVLEDVFDDAEATVVFAANDYEELLDASGDFGLPDFGSLGSTPTGHYGTGLSHSHTLTGVSVSKSETRTYAILASVLLVFVGVAGFLWWRNANPPTATLVVPELNAPGVQVFVDSTYRGLAPITIDALPTGAPYVELRHPDFETVIEAVVLDDDAVVTFERALPPLVIGESTLALTLPEEHVDAEVYFNGAPVTGDGAVRTVSMPGRDTHTIEVRKPGFFVETLQVTAEGDDDHALQETVVLRPVEGTITISSTPTGTAFLDGEERGVTHPALEITGLDPMHVYELEIRPRTPGFRRYQETIVFDGSYNTRMRPRLRRFGQENPTEDVAWGNLVTTDGDTWYRILVDGRDTGRTSPITEDNPLPLKAGERTITFVRPGRETDVSVTIEAEATATANAPSGEPNADAQAEADAHAQADAQVEAAPNAQNNDE